MRNHSNENEFDLHENGRAGETHFHMNGFARRLVLTQRQKVTRKWPIVWCVGFRIERFRVCRSRVLTVVRSTQET